MKIVFNEVSEVTPEQWAALKERIAKRPKSEGVFIDGRPYPDHISATGKFDQLPPHIQKKVLDNHKKK